MMPKEGVWRLAKGVASQELGEPRSRRGRLTKKQQAELLRRTVDPVGKLGEPGEQIKKVTSVGMLSEGWDAKTVTHIMDLRAFSSQLLCEQVVLPRLFIEGSRLTGNNRI